MRNAALLLITISLFGCSPSEDKGAKPYATEMLGYTPDDESFAKNNRAVWIPTNFPAAQFTVDFQDGIFAKGSLLACNLFVGDVQRDTNGLVLTGVPWSTPSEFGLLIEAEITTNMLANIRTAGGKLATVRLAFQVDSFTEVESKAPDDSDRHLLHGKAVTVEPFQAAAGERK
jgi:hypothetical protein